MHKNIYSVVNRGSVGRLFSPFFRSLASDVSKRLFVLVFLLVLLSPVLIQEAQGQPIDKRTDYSINRWVKTTYSESAGAFGAIHTKGFERDVQFIKVETSYNKAWLHLDYHAAYWEKYSINNVKITVNFSNGGSVQRNNWVMNRTGINSIAFDLGDLHPNTEYRITSVSILCEHRYQERNQFSKLDKWNGDLNVSFKTFCTGGEARIEGTPKCNEALAALGVTTSGKLSYSWKADGVQVGNGSGYVPKSEDIGKKITVTITGTDGSCSASSSSPAVTISGNAGGNVGVPSQQTVTGTSIIVNAVAAPNKFQSVEYAINTVNRLPTSGWQTSTVFNGLKPNTAYWVFARAKAGNCYGAGAAQVRQINTVKLLPRLSGNNQFSGVYGTVGDKKVSVRLDDSYPENLMLTVSIGSVSTQVAVNGDKTYSVPFSAAALDALDAGTYTIYASLPEGQSNKEVKNTQIGTLVIAPRQLVIDPPQFIRDKVYDGTDKVLALASDVSQYITNYVGNDKPIVTGSAVYAGADVGFWDITISYSIQSKNYIAPVPTTHDAAGRIKGNITKFDIVVSAGPADDKVYDGTLDYLGAQPNITVRGVPSDQNNGNVTAVYDASSAQYLDKNVVPDPALFPNGNAVRIKWTLTGPKAGNYNSPIYVDHPAKITPRQLTAGIPSGLPPVKDYDGTTAIIPQPTPDNVQGLVAGDAETVVVDNAIYLTADAGSHKDYVVSYRVDGPQASNYIRPDNFTYDNGTINQSTVTLVSVVANGIANTLTSTDLTLTFDRDIDWLTLSMLSLTGDAAMGYHLTKNPNDSKQYILQLASVDKEGKATLGINFQSRNFTLVGTPATVDVHHGPTLLYAHTHANGVKDEYTSDAIVLTFDQQLTWLDLNHLIVEKGGTDFIDRTKPLTTAVSNDFSKWLVPILPSAFEGDVAIVKFTNLINRSINGAPKAVTLHHGVTLRDAVADGLQNTVASSHITLIFDKPIEGLTLNDLTFSNGITPRDIRASADNRSYVVEIDEVQREMSCTVTVVTPFTNASGKPYTIDQPTATVTVFVGNLKSAEFSLSPLSVVYNAQPQGVAVSHANRQVQIDAVYYENATYAKNTQKPTDAGTYTVSVDASGAGFAGAKGLVVGTFTIVPRKLTHDITIRATREYDGTAVAHALSGGLLLSTAAASDEGLMSADEQYIALDSAFTYIRGKNVQHQRAVEASLWQLRAVGSIDVRGNYYLPPFALQLASITPKQLHTDGAPTYSAKDYDGNNTLMNVAPPPLKGVIAGDDVALDLFSHIYDSPSAGQGKGIAIDYTLAGADHGNYIAPPTYHAGDGVINPRKLTVSPPTLETDKEYDGTRDLDQSRRPVAAGLFTNLVPGDVAPILSIASASYDDENAGPAVGITVTYNPVVGGNGNYTEPDPYVTTGEIRRRQLSIKWTGVQPASMWAEKTYDGTTAVHSKIPDFTIERIVSRQGKKDDVSLAATAVYNSHRANTSKVVTVHFGNDPIGTDKDNYLAPADYLFMNGGRINRKKITFDSPATATDREYNGRNEVELSYATATLRRHSPTDINRDDDLCVLTTDATVRFQLRSSDGLVGTITTPDADYHKPVKLPVAHISLIDGGDYSSYNYELVDIPSTAPNGKNVTVNILPRQLHVVNVSIEKVKQYDGTTAIKGHPEVFVEQIADRDRGLVRLTVDAAYDTPDAGKNKTISLQYSFTSRTPADRRANYLLPPEDRRSDGIIEQAELTVELPPFFFEKVYDGTTDVPADQLDALRKAVIVKGRAHGDKAGEVSVDIDAAFASKNAKDPRSVNFKYTPVGPKAANYRMASHSEIVDGHGRITRKRIAVKGVKAINRDYDGTNVVMLDYSAARLETLATGEQLSLYIPTNGKGAKTDNRHAGKNKPVNSDYVNDLKLMPDEEAVNYILDPTLSEQLTVNIAPKKVYLENAAFENRAYEAGNSQVAYTYNSKIYASVAGFHKDVDDVGFRLRHGQMANPNRGKDKPAKPVVELTGAHSGNYEFVPSELSVTIFAKRHDPVWPHDLADRLYNPSFRIDGIDLSAFNDALGRFVWEKPETVPALGTHSYPVRYIPANTADYDYSGIALVRVVPLTTYSDTDIDVDLGKGGDNGAVTVAESVFDTATAIWTTRCGAPDAEVLVTTANPDAHVEYLGKKAEHLSDGQNRFFVDLPQAGIYTAAFDVVYRDRRQSYTVRIERRFLPEEIISMKWDNTLIVDNIPSKNLGYTFVGYQWYANDRALAGETRQHYRAGETMTHLLAPATGYHAAITLADGDVLHTCPLYPAQVKAQKNGFSVYPNPKKKDEPLTIRFNGNSHDFEKHRNKMIGIYNMQGQALWQGKITAPEMTVPFENNIGTYLVRIGSELFKIVINE